MAKKLKSQVFATKEEAELARAEITKDNKKRWLHQVLDGKGETVGFAFATINDLALGYVVAEALDWTVVNLDKDGGKGKVKAIADNLAKTAEELKAEKEISKAKDEKLAAMEAQIAAMIAAADGKVLTPAQ